MTKKGILFLSLAFCLLALPDTINAQCKQFARNTCKPGLDPYQHDGNYDAAALLVEGEVADMYRTLNADVNYRIGVCGSSNLSAIEFKVMDVKDNIIDVTIGPYETYEDNLNGYKAAFEAFIAVRDPADSEKLRTIKNYLQLLENSLPIPDEHKNPNRGAESPISVVDLAFAGGDTKAGVQTLAFNYHPGLELWRLFYEESR